VEVSLCTVPCNPDTMFEIAKSLGMELPRYEEQSQEEARKNRFAHDLERMYTKAESVQNIIRHWHKEGRALTAEQRQRLTQAQAILSELLEAYPTDVEEPEPQGGLSLSIEESLLPEVMYVELPEVPAVELPAMDEVPLPGA